MVDAGIGVSRSRLTKALAALSGDPITHLINSHWHFDHADGNEWLHAAGAKIIAHENTRKHLSSIQRVEDWDYNFLPSPHGAIPADVFAKDHKLKLNGATISLQYHGPAHTDGDITVHFTEPMSSTPATSIGTASIRSSTIPPAAASTARSRRRKPVSPRSTMTPSSSLAMASPSATRRS
jgi:Metallo-beta-lactamase superfamily